VTRADGLRAVSVYEPQDLAGLTQGCLKKRAVGSSTEHAQSSRSHAILRLEVVNQAVIEAREVLEEATAVLPARKNALDNCRTCMMQLLFEGEPRQILRVPDFPSDEEKQAFAICWGVDPDAPVDILKHGKLMREDDWLVQSVDSDNKLSIQGLDCGCKSLQEWAQHLGVPSLGLYYAMSKKQLPEEGQWEATVERLKEQKKVLRQLVDCAQAKVEEASAALASVVQRSPAHVGGSLYVVDLAGADYDHRSGHEQKETAAINKSLLALKECFRSLAGVSTQKPRFRDSKLTRLLEDALVPAATSGRINRESVSVMLVNVSPAATLKRMTLNTLRYGQMYANASTSRGKSGKASAAVKRCGIAGAIENESGHSNQGDQKIKE